MTRARDVSTPTALVLISSTTIGTAVSSVVVNNAFSADYNNYKILVSGGTASTAIDIHLKLGASATGYYAGRGGILYSNAGASNNNTNNASSWNGGIGKGDAAGLHLVADLISPFLAKNTVVASVFVNQAAAGQAGSYCGFHSSAVSYADFTLTTSSGTMTGGTIEVYGYKK